MIRPIWNKILVPEMIKFALQAASASALTTCPGFPGYCSESFPGQSCQVIIIIFVIAGSYRPPSSYHHHCHRYYPVLWIFTCQVPSPSWSSQTQSKSHPIQPRMLFQSFLIEPIFQVVCEAGRNNVPLCQVIFFSGTIWDNFGIIDRITGRNFTAFYSP